METKRAWATFEIKAFDEASRTFEGIASTPTVDFGGDSMDPMGAEYKLPMPFMWAHGKGAITDPVGWITAAAPNKSGIPIKGQFAKPKDDYPQNLKDELNGAWVKMRDGIVRGLSIGWTPMKGEAMKEGYRWLKWGWHELSAVAIGMNQEATVTAIKSIDLELARAASGAPAQPSAVALPTKAGASASHLKGSKVKTTKELIEAGEAKRASLVARQEELMSKAGTEDRVLTEDEAKEYDSNATEIRVTDEHLTRLRAHEKTIAAKAVVIIPASDGTVAPASPGAPAFSWGKSVLPKGVAFARYAQCVGASKGNMMQAAEMARQNFRDTPELAELFKMAASSGNLGELMMRQKSAVAAGTTSDSTWAGPLVYANNASAEFVEYLRPMTILGNLPTRAAPFNIRFPRQTSGTSGTFVGEGLPKPVAKIDFEQLTLTWAKMATIVVMSDELMRFSNPASEMLVRDDLANGIRDYADKRFIDPAYAGVANVSPASITNGVTPIASLGTSVANIEDTCKIALEALANANIPGPYYWIMSPAVAISLSLKRAATIEMRAFPDINAQGGTFLGYPVVTSNNVALSASPTESFVVLCAPNQIMVADDGAVTIDMSNEASLVMDGAPSNPATSTVSLWQSNLVGLRAERYINWRTRHTSSVQVITMNVVW